MSNQSWQETLTTQEAAGTLFNTYTTAKTVINPQALAVLPAGFFKIGRAMRIFVAGALSNIVTTPGLVNFQVKVGSAVVFDSGNIQLNASAHTLLPFWLDVLLTCRAVGAGSAANLIGQGSITGLMFTRTAGQTDDAQGHQTLLVPQTAPAVGAGFDSTIANVLDLWAGFTISNAGNGVQVHQYKAVSLN
jgi:hypothetical protein